MITALYIVAAYLGGVVAFVGLMYLWLWFGGHRSPDARLARAFVVEVGWGALVQLLLPLGLLFWPRRWRRRRSDSEAPVLFVHGYAQNRADFYLMAWRLARRGRGSLFALNYWPFGAVASSAEAVARAVQRVQDATGAERVHLVAHSLGGVVCRHYIEHRDGSDHVASLVAIATPFGGTVRIGLGFGAVTTELTPESSYMLQVGPPVGREGVPYFALWSPADAMVVPPTNASLRGAGAEQVLLGAGHLTLVTSRASAEAVARWLAREPAPSP